MSISESSSSHSGSDISSTLQSGQSSVFSESFQDHFTQTFKQGTYLLFCNINNKGRSQYPKFQLILRLLEFLQMLSLAFVPWFAQWGYVESYALMYFGQMWNLGVWSTIFERRIPLLVMAMLYEIVLLALGGRLLFLFLDGFSEGKKTRKATVFTILIQVFPLFYLPIIGLCMSFNNCPTDYPPEFPSVAAESHCLGTARIVVGSLSIATLFLAILIGFLVSVFYFPWNPSPNNYVATSSCRIWLVLFVCKTLLAISASIFHGHRNLSRLRILIHSFLLMASFGSALGWQLYTFPFYHFRSNVVASALLCFGLITGIMRFLTPVFPNPVVPFILYIILAIPSIIVTVLFAKRRLARLGNVVKNAEQPQPIAHFSNEFEVEISTRYAYFAADQNDMDSVTMTYLNAADQFPQSAAIKVAHCIFLLRHAEEIQLLSVVINRAKKSYFTFSKWDLEYMLFCLDKARKQQLYKLDGGIEEIQRKIRQAMRYQEQCTKFISTFWTQLLKEQDLANLTDIVAQIERNEIMAESIYKKLLLQFPKNTRVLRAYGLFLEEVKNDIEMAEMSYRSADEVEEEKARHHKRNFKLKKDPTVPLRDNYINTTSEDEEVPTEHGFGNEWNIHKEQKERSKSRARRIELLRQRKYKQNIEKSKSTALRKLSIAVIVTAVVLFVDLTAVYVGTRMTLNQFYLSLDLVEDVADCRNLVQHTVRNVRQASIWGTDRGNLTVTHQLKLMVQQDALRLKEFIEEDILSHYDNTKIQDWWEDPIFNQSSMINSDPFNTTRSYENASLIDMSMKFVAYALVIAGLNDTEFIDPSNPAMWYLLDNGIDTLVNGYSQAIDYQTEQMQFYEDEFHTVMAILLGISLLILVGAIALFFVPALKKIREERAKALRLFLAIPKSTIAAICDNLSSKEEESKDMEDEELDELSWTSDTHTQSSGIPIIRKLILRYGFSVILVLGLLGALFGVPFSFVRGYDVIAMEVNFSGMREFLVDRLVFLSWELVHNEQVIWPGGRNQVREYMQNTSKTLQYYESAILYGNDEVGIDDISSFIPLLEQLTFEQPCHVYNSDSQCYGTQSLIKFIIRDAELLRDADDSTLLSNNTLIEEISFLHDQLEIFLLQFWMIFKKYAAIDMTQVATAVSIIYAASFPVLIFSYFTLKPLERRVKEENMRTMKMLLMIPIDVIDQVEEIKTYLDSGLKSDLTDKKINQILQDKLERSKKIIDASTDAIVVINNQGNIEVFNPAAEKLFGYSFQEVLNQNVKMLMPEDVAIVHQGYIERYQTTKVSRMMGKATQRVAKTKSGNLIPISLSLSESSIGHDKTLYAAFIKDITDQKEYEKELLKERDYSEQLLSSLLPASIAKQLKEEIRVQDRSGVLIAEAYKEVTVLFADLVGFTTLSGKIRPTELVQLLNKLFSKWDALAGKYGIEKIKTIGDCYMAASGVPIRSLDHAENALEFAVDMLSSLEEVNRETKYNLQVRIGLNSGPVVAGVIGTYKMAFDLWGDTVNVASRMESTGIPGRIQVSPSTFELLKEEYLFEERGRQQVKGKGVMLTYLYKEPRYDRTASGHKIRRQILTPMQVTTRELYRSASMMLSQQQEEHKELEEVPQQEDMVSDDDLDEMEEIPVVEIDEAVLPNAISVPLEESEPEQPPVLVTSASPKNKKSKKLRKTISRIPKVSPKSKKQSFK